MAAEIQRVVITGMGVASPIGCTIEEFWQALLTERKGITELPPEDYGSLRTRIGGWVADFDGAAYFGRKDARRLSRSSQLALVAVEQALDQACLTNGTANYDEIGVVIGSSIGGFVASAPFFGQFYTQGKASPLVVPMSMNSGPSSNTSIRYGFKGPTLSTDAACASAAHSVGYAYSQIRFGMQEIVIAGGADSAFSPPVVASWAAMRALSERNDNPGEALRPFSGDRDGTVLGEGAGIFILESERSALQRGAVILAEVIGYGASSDSFHITQPSMEGPARAMQRALDDAGLQAGEVDYINAHATGTKWNDSNETSAIKEVFGKYAYEIPVVGNKGAFGHSIAASGALEMAGCVQSLHHQFVPPTLNYKEPDPECDLDYVPEGPRSVEVEKIMTNSFAFGGSNATIVLSKYEADGRAR